MKPVTAFVGGSLAANQMIVTFDVALDLVHLGYPDWTFNGAACNGLIAAGPYFVILSFDGPVNAAGTLNATQTASLQGAGGEVVDGNSVVVFVLPACPPPAQSRSGTAAWPL